MEPVIVVGAGLAGSEAAWQLAARGVPVRLAEMRPAVSSPAHHTGMFAELVCSNSFKSTDPSRAPGMLKGEADRLGSLVLAAATATAVPAGAALAVDRERFPALVTRLIEQHPLVEVVHEEVTGLPSARDTILAAGPLPSEALENALSELIGTERLHFFDAAAPIVAGDSIDRDICFAESRYGKGEGSDYLNCPLDKAEYDTFVDALVSAKRVTLREFETRELFQACQPVEEIARKGRDALRYGAMKPVGLTDPRTGRRPWAVVQLRAENAEGTAYNLVGFQTNLAFGEQARVFRMIPGLKDAEFLRYGVMHRNTFVDSPRLLGAGLALAAHPRVRLAGQLMGTEGYLEAACSGLLAALNVFSALRGLPEVVLPPTTAIGSLLAYATDPQIEDYQPMHANLGLLPPLEAAPKTKGERRQAMAERALRDLEAYVAARRDLDVAAVRRVTREAVNDA